MGHSVTLVCPWAVAHGEEREGVKFVPFPPATRRSQRMKTHLRLLRLLVPLLPDLDIIHFHDLDMLPWMTILSLFKNVVYDVHENYPAEMLTKTWIPKTLRRSISSAVRWGQLMCCNILRNVVLVAKSQEKDIYGPRLRKIYIMNYASVKLLDKVTHDYSSRAAAVIFTGSQYVDNGSHLYLEIVARIHEQRKDVTFFAFETFFGNEPLRQQLIDKVKNRGLDGVYKLLPSVKPHQLMFCLNKATIGVAPDLRVTRRIHAVSQRLFEFMAAGLPIVASDLPYQVEVVCGNNAGLLAKPEEPETFVRAILTLLDNRELAKRLGENGRKAFLEKYTWESQEEAFGDYYRSIMKPAGQSKRRGVRH
jgi:glycosyltransferase involved in cell wall biosynthesis